MTAPLQVVIIYNELHHPFPYHPNIHHNCDYFPLGVIFMHAYKYFPHTGI